MDDIDQRTPPADVMATLTNRLGKHQVFGPPVQHGSTTLVPVAYVRASTARSKGRADHADSGTKLVARPAGAWVIVDDDRVSWRPAVDVNRIVRGGQLALAAVLIAVAVAFRRR
jgi:hypothetical protein